MKFTSITTFVSLLVASAFSGVAASPVAGASALEKREVFIPRILSPQLGTVWTVGQTQNVTWDTSNAPVNITNSEGLILLRFENSTTPVILQNGFDIRLGTVEVIVPWVVVSSDYQIILFGDSGNFSPMFTITGGGFSF